MEIKINEIMNNHYSKYGTDKLHVCCANVIIRGLSFVDK